MSKKSWSNTDSNQQYEMVQDFLDRQFEMIEYMNRKLNSV